MLSKLMPQVFVARFKDYTKVNNRFAIGIFVNNEKIGCINAPLTWVTESKWTIELWTEHFSKEQTGTKAFRIDEEFCNRSLAKEFIKSNIGRIYRKFNRDVILNEYIIEDKYQRENGVPSLVGLRKMQNTINSIFFYFLSMIGIVCFMTVVKVILSGGCN